MRELSEEQKRFMDDIPEAEMGLQYAMATFEDGSMEMIRVFYGRMTDTANTSRIAKLERVLVDMNTWY